MEPSRLEKAIKQAWCKETSSDSNWTPENPALGQCAVTALVINAYFGGKIVWAEAILPDNKKVSHYFNFINEMEIDLTRQQFPKETIIPPGTDKLKGFPTTKDYVLSFPATQERYKLLLRRIFDFLD